MTYRFQLQIIGIRSSSNDVMNIFASKGTNGEPIATPSSVTVWCKDIVILLRLFWESLFGLSFHCIFVFIVCHVESQIYLARLDKYILNLLFLPFFFILSLFSVNVPQAIYIKPGCLKCISRLNLYPPDKNLFTI